MIVLMDIGNTRTKYCTVENKKRNKPQAIINESLSFDFLTEHFPRATKVVVASVSHPELTISIGQWCEQNQVSFQQVISAKNKNTLVSAYEKPEQLGVDRWLALLGVSETFPKKNILIIDSGTATTVDLLTKDGQHQGGWILAGINMLITSVLTNTTQVKANDKAQESITFGINTSENVHHAAWAATVGSVNMAISQSEQQGVSIDEIIITGGNGAKLSSLLAQPNLVIDDLVFLGLQTYI